MSREASRVDYFGLRIPFMELIGLVPERIGSGYARTRLPLREAIGNSRGNVHGGALMSALDFTMSAAARGSHPKAAGVATIAITTNFLAPATTDLTLEARRLRSGKSIAFCEGEIRDAGGALIARAAATFKVIRKPGGD